MTLFQVPPASGCANGMCWIQWWWTVTQKVSLKVSSCQQFKSSVFIQFTMMESHFLMHLLRLMFNRLGQFLRLVPFCLAFNKGWGAFAYTSVNTSVAQFHFSEGSIHFPLHLEGWDFLFKCWSVFIRLGTFCGHCIPLSLPFEAGWGTVACSRVNMYMYLTFISYGLNRFSLPAISLSISVSQSTNHRALLGKHWSIPQRFRKSECTCMQAHT